MSAMGDTDAFRSLTSSSSSSSENSTSCAAEDSSIASMGRIADVSIPFCVLHALDDPLVTWRTTGHNPSKLVESGTGHVMMLLTKNGGHVGWPLGMNPRTEGWRWMNDAVRDFVVAADGALREEQADRSSREDGDGDGGGGAVAARES
uniref:Uncharacterized protein n=2 Tax=Odontella aurita TaxID=265563 RepID=A0A7S4NC69_9STRA|mmetsp:Transcript_57534/g.171593  ORF Transcript_57534/g.171593 Transcript_57534/m.171593 type:complete len:148 (+) Transcript_57534:588-1031(+)